MKKILALLLVSMLCISTTACGGSKNTSTDKVTQNVVESETANASESEEELMTIDTKYGSVKYPSKWKDVLVTSESEDDGILTVSFKTTANKKEYDLFKVMICNEEGDSIGTIVDKEGTTRNVFVDVPELTDVDQLDEETQDQLYAMQEAVNV